MARVHRRVVRAPEHLQRGHAHEQQAARPQHARELGDGGRVVLDPAVVEHVEGGHHVERVRRGTAAPAARPRAAGTPRRRQKRSASSERSTPAGRAQAANSARLRPVPQPASSMRPPPRQLRSQQGRLMARMPAYHHCRSSASYMRSYSSRFNRAHPLRRRCASTSARVPGVASRTIRFRPRPGPGEDDARRRQLREPSTSAPAARPLIEHAQRACPTRHAGTVRPTDARAAPPSPRVPPPRGRRRRRTRGGRSSPRAGRRRPARGRRRRCARPGVGSRRWPDSRSQRSTGQAWSTRSRSSSRARRSAIPARPRAGARCPRSRRGTRTVSSRRGASRYCSMKSRFEARRPGRPRRPGPAGRPREQPATARPRPVAIPNEERGQRRVQRPRVRRPQEGRERGTAAARAPRAAAPRGRRGARGARGRRGRPRAAGVQKSRPWREPNSARATSGNRPAARTCRRRRGRDHGEHRERDRPRVVRPRVPPRSERNRERCPADSAIARRQSGACASSGKTAVP